MRRLNLVFLAILVVGTALLGAGLHLVHGIQVRRNATSLLDRARRAEANREPAKAEEALRWYLSLRPEDGESWSWYARVVDRQNTDRRKLDRLFLVYEQALRKSPGDRGLKRRCADLAMELGHHGDAHDLLKELLETAGTTLAEQAELEDLLGQCEQALGKHLDAKGRFARAIEHDPRRVDAYERLARLQRGELRQDADAAATIHEMIAKNSEKGRAFAYRWRYYGEVVAGVDDKGRREDLARALGVATDDPADEKDVARALELAPDDREVLLTAALAAQQRQDKAAIRTYLERGHRLDPKDVPFALGLARLEAQERHLDRAEAVLRRSFEARPTVLVAFELADTLIQQRKVEGKGEAGDFIALLRRAGLGDTRVRFLDAEVLVQREEWSGAIAELETARAVLASEPELTLRINLMLAECHGQLGSDEQRLDALRRAAQGDQGADFARVALMRALAESGKLDQAISLVSPLAVAGGNPQWRLDLVELLLQKTVRQPRDRRNWQEVELHLRELEKVMPRTAEAVVLLRLQVLSLQDKLDDVRTLLAESLAREPRNLGYRLAMARLAQRQGRADEALRVIDQAEKDLGSSPRIALARLDYWGGRGGDAARRAVGQLAESRGQIPAADRPDLLESLGAVAIRLGRPDLARQYWRELAELKPKDIRIRLSLLDLAIMAGDRDEPTRLVAAIREIEGKDGATWRFARASLLLDQARRGYAEGLVEARRLVAEIADRKKGWWVVPTLNGQIAELAGSPDQAISDYLQALDLGNVQPSFARRLVRLLDQQGRRADVDRVTQVLRDQGAALAEVTIVQALDAIRNKDYDRGISLARQIYPEDSLYASDHFNLGRIYLAAGRSGEAGRELRRAVELGPGVPENWLGYVQYLVQSRQLDQARAAMVSARKALPPDRATLTLAQCALAIGDTKGAEALVKQALEGEGEADDLAALRIAVEVSLRLNRRDAARSYLERIAASSSASADDHAWANRTLAALLMSTNRPADRDQARALVDRNLSDDPENVEDRTLKAGILSMQPGRRGEAIAILEGLAGANRLGVDQRFLLAQLHLGQGEGSKYEGEMLRLLGGKEKDPRHLAHFVNRWIALKQLDQADRWLAELKQADPKGLPALELEARLLDLRKRRSELLALLESRGRDVPDQIGAVAELLDRYGFAKEAEAAYRAFVARDPKRPERALAMGTFLARQDRPAEAMEIFQRALTTCLPEQVALAALPLYDAPSAGEAMKGQIESWVADAVQKNPDSTQLRLRLGLIWLWRGKFDDAAQCFRRILAESPDEADVLNSLAWLLALRDPGRAQEALGLIDHAIDVTGAVPAYMDTRAVVLIRAGQPDQAIRELDRARSADPRNPNFALHQAWAYREKGDAEGARGAWNQAKQLGWSLAKSDPLERSVIQTWGRELTR